THLSSHNRVRRAEPAAALALHHWSGRSGLRCFASVQLSNESYVCPCPGFVRVSRSPWDATYGNRQTGRFPPKRPNLEPSAPVRQRPGGSENNAEQVQRMQKVMQKEGRSEARAKEARRHGTRPSGATR